MEGCLYFSINIPYGSLKLLLLLMKVSSVKTCIHHSATEREREKVNFSRK